MKLAREHFGFDTVKLGISGETETGGVADSSIGDPSVMEKRNGKKEN